MTAPALAANVIVLQSHPAWVAAQLHACERSESMRRHPSGRNLLPEPDALIDDNRRPRTALRKL